MSYLDHYGLSEPPFQLTPDPRFWFESGTHKKAMAYLGYGLQQGEGFVVVTGEIGAGKTSLVALLMDRVDPARVTAVEIGFTQVEGDDLLGLVAARLGLAVDGVARAQLLGAIERTLHDRARAGAKVLLIVDEAQALPHSALEELRMLSNFTNGGRALIQTLLLGQPEFRERLASPALEQLRQRVIATHHLDGMTAGETRGYLEHRLTQAGWTGRPAIDDEACAQLHDASGGIPRRLNQLATRLLLLGAIDDAYTIDGAMVAQVVADAEDDSPPQVAAPVDVAPVASFDSSALDGAVLDHDARIRMLETQIEEQEAALRRVLTLLIDWVEREEFRDRDFARARSA